MGCASNAFAADSLYLGNASTPVTIGGVKPYSWTRLTLSTPVRSTLFNVTMALTTVNGDAIVSLPTTTTMRFERAGWYEVAYSYNAWAWVNGPWNYYQMYFMKTDVATTRPCREAANHSFLSITFMNRCTIYAAEGDAYVLQYSGSNTPTVCNYVNSCWIFVRPILA